MAPTARPLITPGIFAAGDCAVMPASERPHLKRLSRGQSRQPGARHHSRRGSRGGGRSAAQDPREQGSLLYRPTHQPGRLHLLLHRLETALDDRFRATGREHQRRIRQLRPSLQVPFQPSPLPANDWSGKAAGGQLHPVTEVEQPWPGCITRRSTQSELADGAEIVRLAAAAQLRPHAEKGLLPPKRQQQGDRRQGRGLAPAIERHPRP